MKRIISVLLTVVVTAAIGARVHYVNTQSFMEYFPKKQVYDFGESIPMNTGQYYFNDQDAEGYYVKVIESEIVKTGDLLSRYGETYKFLADNDVLDPENYEYTYLVTVEFTYEGSEDPHDKAVHLPNFNLVGPDYYINFSDEINLLEGFNEILGGGTTFAITSGNALRLQLPYLINTKSELALSVDYIQRNPPKLIVTYYPTEAYGEIE